MLTVPRIAVTAFARKTGDLAVLSSADIRVLALCLTLELEENGTWRVREFPGQVLIPPPKDDKAKDEGEDGGKGKDKEQEDAEASAPATGEEPSAEPSTLVESLATLNVEDKEEDEKPVAPTSEPEASPSSLATEAESTPAPAPSSSTISATAPPFTPAASSSASTSAPAAGGEDEDEDVSDAESDSSAGSWITPDNVHAHKVRDLGLFEAPEASTSAGPAASTSTAGDATPTAASSTAPAPKAPKPKTIMKAAVLTGDYAMQNVALQMGLNVLGSGGKRVREVRTWVLRCHACFK